VQTELLGQRRDRTTTRHQKVTAVGLARCRGPKQLGDAWVRLIIPVRAHSHCLLYVPDWETLQRLKRVGFKPELAGSR
jgi:hypothetical protein